ncbi:hypothetical protein [Streptomyces sparsogenes]|uniref:hypothetical protein n=1 Tax=Streptomyces sparsogenes TaxID=67365 RepID=UPI0033FC90F9
MTATAAFTTADIPTAPEGLIVSLAEQNALAVAAGVAFRAQCQHHDYCRNTTMLRWCAGSWEDLVLRVFPAYLLHCQQMEELEEAE